MVRSMWLFKHTFDADGNLSRYKARLVANGSSQQLVVDFDGMFSLVIKPTIVRTVLSLAISRKWPIHQLDVKNAFLNGDLSETVYMHQLLVFVGGRGGKFAALRLLTVRFHILRSWESLYTILSLFMWMTSFLSFLSNPTSKIIGLFLSQKKYALQLLERTHMVTCNPSRTPIDTESKLDLSYAFQQICLYMHDPREPHFAALKRILRYVRGTMDFGLQLYIFATTSLVGYTDADWAGCPSTHRSTSRYYVFLGDNILSWSAKRQHTISRSSAEAEYRGVANVVVVDSQSSP
ncbi:ribonuclease H-like domain-containing protein [Tanacetum coccineum]|uniref:Ribonuclease H-like domain-containing protein n=1 Tax=Tanacetum coccineum TaxID=301880 RepID=A0ABQ5D3V4_9ASTR